MSKNSRLGGPFDKQSPHTLPFWAKKPLPYLLITVTVIDLDKVSISAMQNLKTSF